MSQNRVSLISRDIQTVKFQSVLTRIADGLGMPDHARAWLGLEPAPQDGEPQRRAAKPALPDQAAELLRHITSARYLDEPVIDLLQQETDAIRLLDRRLGAPAVTAKLGAHVSQIQEGLRYSLSPARRERLALVLTDAAALAGWQAIDMGNLPAAWRSYELAAAAAREAGDASGLAHAAGEQAYVLLDLGEPAQALEKVRMARESAGSSIPARLRCWLYAAEAEMAAAARQQSACRAALDLADSELASSGADDPLPYLSLDPAHLARWRGNCLVRFGDTATIADLTTALAGMDSAFTRAEAGLRCDLAAALHAAGERDEARDHLGRAIELARLTASARQRRRIAGLAHRIGYAA
ncbi:MAG TPA: XRE family transcriptional regulator [Streptosporangiaceae bacterium]|nr:XRE family transcriptional regulator [Streptosporangiaceae bacterium]